MRLIDADLIGLTDFEIITCDGNYKTGLEILLKKIEEAPVINQWIPCSERLPSQQQTVLIQDFGEITIGYLNAENRWRDLTNQADYLKGVEAWMPLPEPYKEDEE